MKKFLPIVLAVFIMAKNTGQVGSLVLKFPFETSASILLHNFEPFSGFSKGKSSLVQRYGY
jgi:hypothetical protein